jgi:hypothetical protein
VGVSKSEKKGKEFLVGLEINGPLALVCNALEARHS